MRLVNVLSKLYSPSLNHPVNPEQDILVSVGAYGSLFYSINALTEKDDEVIIIEPFFDCYQPMVEACGAIPRFLPYRLVRYILNNHIICNNQFIDYIISVINTFITI